MKTVGHRQLNAASSIDDQGRLARVAGALQSAADIPSGVYRFDSFEEAERWHIEMMAHRARERRSQQILPASAAR